MENYYELIEVSPTASVEVIKAAIKAKVKLWHPDNYQNWQEKEKATYKIQKLTYAMDILTDSEKRKEYDEKLRKFLAGGKESSIHRQPTEEEELEQMLDRVQKMIILTTSEKDYLQLHNQIRQSNYPEREKMLMAEALDYITTARLEKEIERAESLEECKKNVSDIRNGAIITVVIGLFLTNWFVNAWWIAGIIAILGYIGNSGERNELEKAKQAESRIQEYKLNGFRLRDLT